MHVVCANIFGANVLKPRFNIDVVLTLMCLKLIILLLKFMIIVPGPVVANISAGSRLNYKCRHFSGVFFRCDVSHKGTVDKLSKCRRHFCRYWP